jgi:hypothetical protein
MNERIKELAHKADFIIKKNNGAEWRWGHIDPELAEKLEKFAELIVQECVGVTNAEMDDILDQPVFNPTDEIWNRARVEELVRVVQLIKKHFGVEE